jgi:DNA polymerase I|mmetsp:Transcript_65274/g.180997  ORF Transcript_65274/g.180997 Transcript_65274/m.180997 type:complete len:89 (-) Transcript_65274:370-636(-)|eukprot:CAMPEP_0119523394 /NCGR_PEP_ID=MMETSP1344-20130328/38466_1 /TAXON_ID=236787 /ORGANISM="Florenciella parvula, Strain CCMP2471" /LENGTH=88 /DNA_ID=CAMNT_0007561603 /DNA_START=52 /DNA_END=318 /DNA_ORIENTATION=+
MSQISQNFDAFSDKCPTHPQAQSIAGTPFNLSSPEQVASVLYTKLQLPAPSTGTTSKGAASKHPSTSEEVLKGLVQRSPVVQLILKHR